MSRRFWVYGRGGSRAPTAGRSLRHCCCSLLVPAPLCPTGTLARLPPPLLPPPPSSPTGHKFQSKPVFLSQTRHCNGGATFPDPPLGRLLMSLSCARGVERALMRPSRASSLPVSPARVQGGIRRPRDGKSGVIDSTTKLLLE